MLEHQLLSVCPLLKNERLTDEIIEAYSKLLKRREENKKNKLDESQSIQYRTSFFLSPFFYSKLTRFGHHMFDYDDSGIERWLHNNTTNFKFADHSKVFIPLLAYGTYWALIVINVDEKKVCYYDPTGTNDRIFVENIMLWIARELAVEGLPFCKLEWTTIYKAHCPIESSCVDCGLFVMINMKMLCENNTLTRYSYDQSDAAYWRWKIAYDLVQESELL